MDEFRMPPHAQVWNRLQVPDAFTNLCANCNCMFVGRSNGYQPYLQPVPATSSSSTKHQPLQEGQWTSCQYESSLPDHPVCNPFMPDYGKNFWSNGSSDHGSQPLVKYEQQHQLPWLYTSSSDAYIPVNSTMPDERQKYYSNLRDDNSSVKSEIKKPVPTCPSLCNARRRRILATQIEKRRTEKINAALDVLRDILPSQMQRRRLSKIQTLRLALNYIQELKTTVGSDGQLNN